MVFPLIPVIIAGSIALAVIGLYAALEPLRLVAGIMVALYSHQLLQGKMFKASKNVSLIGGIVIGFMAYKALPASLLTLPVIMILLLVLGRIKKK